MHASTAHLTNRAPDDAAACPVCAGPGRAYCVKRDRGIDWRIRICRRCGHGWVANRPTLAMLEEIYSTDASHHPTSTEAPRDQRIGFIEHLGRLCQVRGDSLDVGSGGGEFSQQLYKHGFRPVMIDLDPRTEIVAKHVPQSEFHRAAFENFAYPGAFGAIVMSQVLEHALDPLSWLAKARQLLVPGGVLAVALPNFGGVYRMLGRRDPFLIPPLHLNYFTRSSLRRAFVKTNLEPLGFDSSSHVFADPRRASPRVVRRAAAAIWNLGSRVLDRTPFGIMLQGYARRSD